MMAVLKAPTMAVRTAHWKVGPTAKQLVPTMAELKAFLTVAQRADMMGHTSGFLTAQTLALMMVQLKVGVWV
jgi:hypothetical protein